MQKYIAFFMIVLFFLGNSNSFAKTSFVTIGTGGVTGIYYPAGGAIAKLINKKRKKYGIRASVESTAGSVYNINAVLSGDLEFGIAQSDRQYQAYNGLAEWKQRGKQTDLRAICSLHPEIITLVAAIDGKISSLKNLKGKRVNLGDHGSGHRGNAIEILNTIGINWKNDLKSEALKAAEAPKMLQDNRIDAFFYTVGHPNGAIMEATAGKRKVLFVPINGMEALIKKSPYYAPTKINISDYPMAHNKKNVDSIGVMTTFVTSTKVSADVVYGITKELFDNLEEFKKLHKAFAHLTKESMLSGLSAPLHPGALRYFKEVGLK
ncbi:MAG: TAXI family TRAP transporter solute-binding subunit [Bacteriovoracaceae bacterium]|nr:TAXI family TRAP transporter solute-binding subunit [Bacteriovoracaceae bacterium]